MPGGVCSTSMNWTASCDTTKSRSTWGARSEPSAELVPGPLGTGSAEEPELPDVAADGGLGGGVTEPPQLAGQLLLGVDRPVLDQLQDGPLAVGLGAEHSAWPRVADDRIEACGQDAHGLIDITLVDDQWRHQADHPVADGVDQEPVVERLKLERLGDVLVQQEGLHQACSPGPGDRPEVPGEVREAMVQVGAGLGHAGQQVLTLDRVEDGQRGGAGQWVAPKVEPWSPTSKTSARWPAMHAPIGTPPPRPLARVTTSGTTTVLWKA